MSACLRGRMVRKRGRGWKGLWLWWVFYLVVVLLLDGLDGPEIGAFEARAVKGDGLVCPEDCVAWVRHSRS